ncbi:hypothetical protein [Lutispora sp.]|uniref:hypothetical protein n=1 Tax=Lutispora sp. TaxID=2828727 RepID=UPI00356AFDA4
MDGSSLHDNFNNMLKSTELTGKDIIITSVISSVLAVLLLYILKNIFMFIIGRVWRFVKWLKKKVIVLWFKTKGLKKYIIRKINGELSYKEYKKLEQLEKKGKKLTTKQIEKLKEAKDKFKFVLNSEQIEQLMLKLNTETLSLGQMPKTEIPNIDIFKSDKQV